MHIIPRLLPLRERLSCKSNFAAGSVPVTILVHHILAVFPGTAQQVAPVEIYDVVFKEKGDLLTALASFSYAHAWLDAGVRAKLFEAEDDQLFTLP